MRDKDKWERASDALTKINRWKGAKEQVQVLREIMLELREDERVAIDKENAYQVFKNNNAELSKIASDYATNHGRLTGERTRALQDRDTLERLMIKALKYREPEE